MTVSKKNKLGQVRIGKSNIHGNGAIANRMLYPGEILVNKELHRKQKLKFYGFNNSCHPNVILFQSFDIPKSKTFTNRLTKNKLINVILALPSSENDVLSVVTKLVKPGEELTVCYGGFNQNNCNCLFCQSRNILLDHKAPFSTNDANILSLLAQDRNTINKDIATYMLSELRRKEIKTAGKAILRNDKSNGLAKGFIDWADSLN